MKVKIKSFSCEWNVSEHGADESCVMFVQGVSMRYPLCGVLVESGTKHTCDGRCQSPTATQKAPRKKSLKRG